jgi:hypothetical protein
MAEPPKPRRHSRIPVLSAAKVRISAPGISLSGLLLDTSEGGLAITVLGEPLQVGQVVTVELLESGPEKLPVLKATVRYSIGSRHGLEFVPEQ